MAHRVVVVAWFGDDVASVKSRLVLPTFIEGVWPMIIMSILYMQCQRSFQSYHSPSFTVTFHMMLPHTLGGIVLHLSLNISGLSLTIAAKSA